MINENMTIIDDINDMPAEVTMTVIPTISPYGTVCLYRKVMDDYTQIAEPIEITFKTISGDVIKNGVVENLKAESTQIRAEAEMQCKIIEDKIQSLLALPDNSGDTQ